MTANPCIQAMLAGNTVVAKGSEITPHSSYILEELCREAGIPEGVCTVLIGDGKTGAALASASIDKMSFTGSVATGRKVAAACLERLIPCTLELGGKDAMIVCADADLDKAAHGAVWGGCINTGHYCCGIERIYVESSVYNSFVQKVTKIVSDIRLGQIHEFDEDIGAVFWDKQLSIIKAHLADAISKGAKVLIGGDQKNDKDGLYFEPTVVVNVDETSDLMTEETFGPILPIVSFESTDEAIKKANDSSYGLHGSVWTNNIDKGVDISKRIKTGAMSVNDIGIVYGIPSAPFGGVKESGLGSVNGINGLQGYTQPMPIVIGQYRGEDSGYPYSKQKYQKMKKMMNFVWKNPVGRFLFGS